jgi:hypothetical protein
MGSTGTAAVDRGPGVEPGRNVPVHNRRRRTERKFIFESRRVTSHGPAVAAMVLVREVDATVVPRIAVAATLGFETG